MGERLPEKFHTGKGYSALLYFMVDHEIFSFGHMFFALCLWLSLVQVA